MDNKLKIILPIVLISSSAFVLFQVKNNSTTVSESSQDSKSSIDSTDQTTTPTNFQKLSILENRCRGCGKCVRIDPSHFEMSGEVAIVTSSQNLDSSSLQLAINNCPVGVITLE